MKMHSKVYIFPHTNDDLRGLRGEVVDRRRGDDGVLYHCVQLDTGGRIYHLSDIELMPAEAAGLMADMEEAIGWYLSFYRDVQAVAPGYFQECYDLNAVEYLQGEAQRIANQLAAIRARHMDALSHDRTPDAPRCVGG